MTKATEGSDTFVHRQPIWLVEGTESVDAGNGVYKASWSGWEITARNGAAIIFRVGASGGVRGIIDGVAHVCDGHVGFKPADTTLDARPIGVTIDG